MLVTEMRPCAVAVVVAFSGALLSEKLCRLARIRVVFPDIGPCHVTDFGFLRYGGEPEPKQ